MAIILVVDDESVTRRLVTHALKVLNVEVLAAEDGADALAKAQDTTLTLAIVDINLPDVDGFTLIRQLKALPHLGDVPMIVFTARNHAGDDHSAKEAGAAGLLYKPFSTQELRDLVQQYLP